MKPDGKVVLLGDMNVSKTSLLHRYIERRFQDMDGSNFMALVLCTVEEQLL